MINAGMIAARSRSPRGDVLRLVVATALFAVAAAPAAAAPSWGPVQTLATETTLASSPLLAVAPSGGAVMLWDTARGVRAASRRPDGRWASPVTIGPPVQLRQKLAIAADGRAATVWEGSAGRGRGGVF